MYIQKFIQAPEFTELCRSHEVKSVYGFGSAITENFSESSSDIDLLVEIDEPDPLKRGNKLFDLWDKLESLFKRRVDLITPGSMQNPVFRRNVEQTKVLLYER